MRDLWLRIIEWIQWLALAVWVGSMVFLSLVTAPVAFQVLPSPEMAGLLVGEALDRFYLLSYVLGPVILLAAAVRVKLGRVRPGQFIVMATVVLVVIGFNVYAREVVANRLASLRETMGKVEAIDARDPRRLAFDRLHQRSVRLMGGSLIGGLVVMYLMIGGTDERRRR